LLLEDIHSNYFSKLFLILVRLLSEECDFLDLIPVLINNFDRLESEETFPTVYFIQPQFLSEKFSLTFEYWKFLILNLYSETFSAFNSQKLVLYSQFLIDFTPFLMDNTPNPPDFPLETIQSELIFSEIQNIFYCLILLLPGAIEQIFQKRVSLIFEEFVSM
jgi:hypothetical protein